MNKTEMAQKKRQVLALNKLEQKKNMEERRRIKRLERRCFWTWPWGHAYVSWTCQVCMHTAV